MHRSVIAIVYIITQCCLFYHQLILCDSFSFKSSQTALYSLG